MKVVTTLVFEVGDRVRTIYGNGVHADWQGLAGTVTAEDVDGVNTYYVDFDDPPPKWGDRSGRQRNGGVWHLEYLTTEHHTIPLSEEEERAIVRSLTGAS